MKGSVITGQATRTGEASIGKGKGHAKRKAKSPGESADTKSAAPGGLRLLDSKGKDTRAKAPVSEAARHLKDGSIVAVCCRAGSVLLCDATSEKALKSLRERTDTPREPLVLVFADTQTLSRYCSVNDTEKTLLESSGKPAVILAREENSKLPDTIAPNLVLQPVRLADGPPEKLLAESGLDALVANAFMPVKVPETEDLSRQVQRLIGVAGFFLVDELHDSPLPGDAVFRTVHNKPVAVHRGAGSDAHILSLPPGLAEGPEIVALGADVDNTICCVRDAEVFLSGQRRNIENIDSLDAFKHSIADLWKLAGIQLPVIAHSADPGSRSASHARTLKSVGFMPVHHHLAHVAGCMAEHGETSPVLGVVYDSPAFGGDGTYWGAEFLAVTPASFRRLGHLRHVRWPGGPQAIREPWRIAVSLTDLAYGYQTYDICRELFPSVPPAKLRIVCNMLEKGLRSPFGASMGAFMEAMGAIAGLYLEKSYDREPVLLLESLVRRFSSTEFGVYSYDILDDGNLLLVDPARIVYEAVENMLARRSAEMVAARLFETIAEFTVEACRILAPRADTDKIVLSGEVFESSLLTERISDALEQEGFAVLTHSVVPPNDGGISVGQAYVARARHTNRFREG